MAQSFEKLAQDIINQSLVGSRETERRARSVRPRPAAPQRPIDFSGPIQQITGGVAQAGAAIAAGAIQNREDTAADRERIELIREVFPREKFITVDKAGRPSIVSGPQSQMLKISDDIQDIMSQIADSKGAIRRTTKTEGFGAAAELRKKERGLRKELRTLRKELNAIAPGKKVLKEMLQRQREAELLRAKTAPRPVKGPDPVTAETADEMRKRFKVTYEKLHTDMTSKKLPAADVFKLGLNTLDNLKADKEVLSRAAPAIQTTMAAASTAKAQDIFDKVRAWDQDSINKILNDPALTDGEKRQMLVRGMLDRMDYLDEKRAKQFYQESFGLALLAAGKARPSDFEDLEGWRLHTNNVKNAALKALTEDETEAFDDDYRWKGQNIVNNWAAALKKAGVDVKKTNFGGDRVFFVDLEKDTKKRANAGIEEAGDKFVENFNSFITTVPGMVVDAPASSREASEAIDKQSGPAYEYLVNVARARGWLPKKADYRDRETQRILRRNFLGSKWDAFFALIKGAKAAVATVDLPKREERKAKRKGRSKTKTKTPTISAGFFK